MNIYKERESNIFRTWALMTMFLVIVIILGWSFSLVYNNQVILVGAIIFSLFMNVLSYWFSDSIVLSMYSAKPVTRNEYPDLWNITENLSITAGIPMPKLYVINERQPNAFATGRNPEHGVVAVTTGLLDILEKSELEGVVAHEMAHIGNRDTLLQTVVVVLVGFVALLSDMFLRAQIFNSGRDENKAGTVLVIVGLILAVIAPIAVTLIQLAISRKREYLADATGALFTRYPEGLAGALQKISSSSIEMRKANHATAHLFISNPFSGGGKKISSLFSTHPPVEERIKRLRGIK